MLQISRRVEYALRACVHLARQPAGTLVSFRDIAEAEDVPSDYLAKILRGLSDGGILESVRGATGGFRLARPADDITFLDVIEAAEGPVALNDCCTHGPGCPLASRCAMKHVWRKGEEAMLAVFRETRLAQLIYDCPGLALSMRTPASRATEDSVPPPSP